MKKPLLFTLLSVFTAHCIWSQFSLDGEFRPRAEYRNGFGTLIAEDSDAGFAIATRARLNANYAVDSYTFYLSIQDVLVWGENRQIQPIDANNSFAIFEAWADISLGNGWSTKLGRQVIDYDDQRIFGGLDWAQQARNHDAALLRYTKDKTLLDFALAFNQDFETTGGFQSESTAYNITGFFSYKTMQYLYLKHKWKNITGSFLALNNGFQNFEADGTTPDGTSNLQTFGTHLEFRKSAFGADLNTFVQTGERQGAVAVGGAYLFGLDLSYKATDKLGLGAGVELISGNDPQTTDKTEAFFPLYGTNHKFNGLMDYFYVGNHANTIGLLDVHVSGNFKFSEKSNLSVKVLNFSGEQALPSGEKSLGTEIDFVFSQGFKGYNLQLGYSQLFPNDGMYELKGVPKTSAASLQNWAWAMLTIKPKFLNTAKD